MVNRSGLPVEIGLTGNIINQRITNTITYYLRLPKNDPRGDTVREFTIFPDKYSMKFYYVELWDPVYGTHCRAATQSVEAYHNTRVVVPVCTITPPNKGEPSMVKIGGKGNVQSLDRSYPEETRLLILTSIAASICGSFIVDIITK